MKNVFSLEIEGTKKEDIYCAKLEGGKAPVSYEFEWKSNSPALVLGLAALEKAALAGEPPENEAHIEFGKNLFNTIFDGTGKIGKAWTKHLEEADGEPLRLVLRIDPETARPLMNLPWEYLHDGDDFLALDWRTPISRLPYGLDEKKWKPLEETLRVLVMIPAPSGLNQNEVLDVRGEEDLLLGALSPVHRDRPVEIEFTPNGKLKTLTRYLKEFDPHVLHFVGHGNFMPGVDAGSLLMEGEDGERKSVKNEDFARALKRAGRSLRLVFLSSCQTAVPARNANFINLGHQLLQHAGVSAVVAMQFSVLNRSAMDFGAAFYRGLVDGETVDAALTEARLELQFESMNTVDFATPVLFLRDPACLQVDKDAMGEGKLERPLDLSGVTTVARFVGRSVELRELQTNLDPVDGRWRAAVIYGLGGMGKTVLAARLAERMLSRLDGVKTLRMTRNTTGQDILRQISDFLRVNQVRFDHPLIAQFNQSIDQPTEMNVRIGTLSEILKSLKLLLVFDNCEDVLEDGQAVSRASIAGEGQTESAIDATLLPMLATLVGSVSGPSRFLFTSRVDFEPAEAGRMGGEIGHLALGEMGFRDAVYLMESLPPLDDLPVAAVAEVRGEGGAAAQPLTMRRVYAGVGGHPYTLNLFAQHSARAGGKAAGVQKVLQDLSEVNEELREFTLLERAVDALDDDAARLLRHAAVYDEPVPLGGLSYIVGNEQDANPDVRDARDALLGWGLLAQEPGGEDYNLHSVVKDWARAAWTEAERAALQKRAAEYWVTVGNETGDLWALLAARRYYFALGEYETADDIVHAVWIYLLRWGHIELILNLWGESIATLTGNRQRIARSNLAYVYDELGDYNTARKIYEEALAGFETDGSQRQIAQTLHQLGLLHERQGEYPEALARYQQSLEIKEELDNREGIASTLHQLGLLHQMQGEYPEALARYQQSLEIEEELGNREGIATSLHQLGVLHQMQGEYPEALARYHQSLKIKEELGNRAGIARSLHQLGNLYYLQGKFGEALARNQQSLEIKEQLGDRVGIARSFGQMALLHQKQGEMEAAVLSVAQAYLIFTGIGAAETRQVTDHAQRLYREMGAEAFTAALASLPLEVQQAVLAAAQAESDQPDLRETLISNTAAVMTNSAQHKDDWIGQLKEMQEGEEDQEYKQYLNTLLLLIEGGDPVALLDEVPDDYREDWAQIMERIEKYQSGDTEDEQPDPREMMIKVTVGVLTEKPEQKEEWIAALQQLHGQAPPEDEAMKQYLSALLGLLEGGDPVTLMDQVPDEYLSDWAQIIDKIKKYQA